MTVLLCVVAAGALLAGGCSTETTAPGTTVTTEPPQVALEYSIRDTGPAGGVVFFASSRPFPCGEDLTAYCNYLEASPQSAEVRRPWGTETEPPAGTGRSAIGTGWRNTVETVRQGNDDPATSAAAYADAYVFGGKDDWYLPSKDEAFTMLVARELVGGFTPEIYWTSTERDAAKAWYQDFSNGFQFNAAKRFEHLVRPIRAF